MGVVAVAEAVVEVAAVAEAVSEAEVVVVAEAEVGRDAGETEAVQAVQA